MRVPLANHLLRVVEITGYNRVAERPNENFAHPAPTAVRGKITVFRMVDVDLRGLREPLENRPCAVRRDRRRPNVLIEHQQEVAGVLLTTLSNCFRAIPSLG